jgi:hypothetical protein
MVKIGSEPFRIFSLFHLVPDHISAPRSQKRDSEFCVRVVCLAANPALFKPKLSIMSKELRPKELIRSCAAILTKVNITQAFFRPPAKLVTKCTNKSRYPAAIDDRS